MKVVLAHGTFDLLHAGHVAHLEAARAMGDYLVVGVTADDYVQKGPGRPSVTALDRVRAVRALRCVDEAVIDAHATPEFMIRDWQPAVFAKGADYQGQEIPEQEWVERYGGEVRFTNGDVMYHSRQWLTGDARALMAQQGVRVPDLLDIVDRARDYRIHVVGDLIIDEYVQGELIGPLTLRVTSREQWRGGAEAVARHAKAAGARVTMTVTHSARPPLKTRYYGPDGLLCQIDDVDSTPLPPDEAVEALRTVPTDAVIFADYRHGVFHAESIKVLKAAIPAGALKVADSQVASRWGNILDFAGFDLVTPNEREARWATGMQDQAADSVVNHLRLQGHFHNILLTRGAEGLLGIGPETSWSPDHVYASIVPALATQVVDPVGAGDALLAYATLGLLASKSLVTAAWLGSVAAAIACSRWGNAPVTADEVRQWLERL